jgi:hypothetical protein
MSTNLTVYSLVKILDNHIGQPDASDPEHTVQIFRSVLLHIRNPSAKPDKKVVTFAQQPKPQTQTVKVKLSKQERKRLNIDKDQISLTQFLAFKQWETSQVTPPTYSQCQAS